MRLYLVFVHLPLFLLVFTSNGPLQAEVKVACVGDSITEGINLGDRSYPSRLGSLLGDSYTVHNYGAAGYAVLSKSDMPYRTTAEYKASLSWNPDIVLILLGTNDSKPENWKYKEEFISDLRVLVLSYQALSKRPRIILGTPPPVYGGFDQSIVSNQIVPRIRFFAKESQLEYIEFHDRLLDAEKYFPDGIHPDAAGTALMAAIACDFIVRLDSTPPLLIISAKSSSLIEIQWQSRSPGYVVQERSFIDQHSSDWIVSKGIIPKNDGSNLSAIIQHSNLSGFLRLWRP